MKQCSKCKVEKALDQFSKDLTKKDGLCYKCKDCYRLYNQENKAEIAAYQKRYNQSPEGKLSQRKRDKSYNLANPEKVKAKAAVNHAIRDGKLLRPSGCPICGKLCTPEGHHPSYLKEDRLKVVWLCRACHLSLHQVLNRI